MGIFANLKAVTDVRRIKMSGGTAMLSNAQIVSMVINLEQAKAVLSVKQFWEVQNLYHRFTKDKAKRPMDYQQFRMVAGGILSQFEQLGPDDVTFGMIP